MEAEINERITTQTKNGKKIYPEVEEEIDLKEWIQLLATKNKSRLINTLMDCLYDEYNQVRQILPPIMTQKMKASELQRMIETGVASFRATATSPNATTTSNLSAESMQWWPWRLSNTSASDYMSDRTNEAIRDIEQAIGGPVKGPLMPFIEQHEIPYRNLAQAYARANGNQTAFKSMMESL